MTLMGSLGRKTSIQTQIQTSIFELGRKHCSKQISWSQIKKQRVTNSVESDEMAHDEPSHLDLHCLQNICFSLKG